MLHVPRLQCQQQMTRKLKRTKTFYFISFHSFTKFILHLMLNDTIQNTHNLIQSAS